MVQLGVAATGGKNLANASLKLCEFELQEPVGF